MLIEVWSDFVCPFCYIGKRRLEEALAQFSEKDQVEVEFKSYQLDPHTPAYTGQDYHESLTDKFRSVTRAKLVTSRLTQQGKTVGIDFDFDNAKIANTLAAHRLTKYAGTVGKEEVITEALLKAHFCDARDIGDVETLADIAAEVGMVREDVLTVLTDKQAYATEVEADIAEAKQLEISSVPYFIINRKYALSGAQPVEAFTQAINKAWEEGKEPPVFEDLSSNDDATCDDDGCSIS